MKKLVSFLLVVIFVVSSAMSVSAESPDVAPAPPVSPKKSATAPKTAAGAAVKKTPKISEHDGSVDYSYYNAGMMEYTVDTYPIPEELAYDPLNPIDGQLRRDTTGRLWIYEGTLGRNKTAMWGLVTLDSPEKKDQVYPLYTWNLFFKETVDKVDFYNGVGAPVGNQTKIVDGRTYIYGSVFGWIPELAFGGITHMGIESNVTKSGLSFEAYFGFKFK